LKIKGSILLFLLKSKHLLIFLSVLLFLVQQSEGECWYRRRGSRNVANCGKLFDQCGLSGLSPSPRTAELKALQAPPPNNTAYTTKTGDTTVAAIPNVLADVLYSTTMRLLSPLVVSTVIFAQLLFSWSRTSMEHQRFLLQSESVTQLYECCYTYTAV
jgi:hypothetical protein